jgi:hypothetical protein
MARDGCLRMNEGAFVHYRAVSSEFVEHIALYFSRRIAERDFKGWAKPESPIFAANKDAFF